MFFESSLDLININYIQQNYIYTSIMKQKKSQNFEKASTINDTSQNINLQVCQHPISKLIKKKDLEIPAIICRQKCQEKSWVDYSKEQYQQVTESELKNLIKSRLQYRNKNYKDFKASLQRDYDILQKMIKQIRDNSLKNMDLLFQQAVKIYNSETFAIGLDKLQDQTKIRSISCHEVYTLNNFEPTLSEAINNQILNVETNSRSIIWKTVQALKQTNRQIQKCFFQQINFFKQQRTKRKSQHKNSSILTGSTKNIQQKIKSTEKPQSTTPTTLSNSFKQKDKTPQTIRPTSAFQKSSNQTKCQKKQNQQNSPQDNDFKALVEEFKIKRNDRNKNNEYENQNHENQIKKKVNLTQNMQSQALKQKININDKKNTNSEQKSLNQEKKISEKKTFDHIEKKNLNKKETEVNQKSIRISSQKQMSKNEDNIYKNNSVFKQTPKDQALLLYSRARAILNSNKEEQDNNKNISNILRNIHQNKNYEKSFNKSQIDLKPQILSNQTKQTTISMIQEKNCHQMKAKNQQINKNESKTNISALPQNQFLKRHQQNLQSPQLSNQKEKSKVQSQNTPNIQHKKTSSLFFGFGSNKMTITKKPDPLYIDKVFNNFQNFKNQKIQKQKQLQKASLHSDLVQLTKLNKNQNQTIIAPNTNQQSNFDKSQPLNSQTSSVNIFKNKDQGSYTKNIIFNDQRSTSDYFGLKNIFKSNQK